MTPVRASLASQLGNAPCEAEDTEEMFWLREADDFQSKTALGNGLAAQYRFREAIGAYLEALEIKHGDRMTHLRLGGAYLTLFRFNEAMAHYRECLALGAEEKTVAFPMGVWHYLKGGYAAAADWFEKVLPCAGELEIAVIYWHTLCCCRLGKEPGMLKNFRADMDVGHHTAYRLAVEVFRGDVPWKTAVERIRLKNAPLDCVIVLYGTADYLELSGCRDAAGKLRKELLACDDCWPCIAYLAAWNDAHAAASGTIVP